ncbi:uncharacterized protein LOC126318704 [Schistocerca gregaria]|uniref:uncharacterized protein LOC126318704 n=1 Tax=Schistocerca gregaria TaxID=7010 RepID=UPI00211EDAF4|nr:uncharacterized protein LOC126318704 [Schistocerca gregaria]
MNFNPYPDNYEQNSNFDYAMANPELTAAAEVGMISTMPPQKFESAIDFLERVKKVYADEPSVYNSFLDIMKGFKTQRIDTPGVISRVHKLFATHPDLISGFSSFLPNEYKMSAHTASGNGEGGSPSGETSANVNEAQQTRSSPGQSGNTSPAYNRPPSQRGGANSGGHSANEVQHGSAPANKAHASSSSSSGSSCSSKPLSIQPGQVPGNSNLSSMTPGLPISMMSSAAMVPVTIPPATGGIQLPLQALPTIQTMNTHLLNGNGSASVNMHGGSPSVGAAQGYQQPTAAVGATAPGFAARSNPELGEEHARFYVRKIKARFNNQPHIYKAFLDILHNFHKEWHTINDVLMKVSHLFKGHDDLLAEFAQFLPDSATSSTQASLHQVNSAHASALHMPPHAVGKMPAGSNMPYSSPSGGKHHSSNRGSTRSGASANASVNSVDSGVRRSNGSMPPGGSKVMPMSSFNHLNTISPEFSPALSLYQNSIGAMPSSLTVPSLNPQATQQGSLPSNQLVPSTWMQPQMTQLHPIYTPSAAFDVGHLSMSTSPLLLSAHQGPSPAPDPGQRDGSYGTFEELFHFFKIRQSLSSTDYENFLKLLNTYNADMLSKVELYHMVRDLLKHHPELLDWFRSFIQVEDVKHDHLSGCPPHGSSALQTSSPGAASDFDWNTSEKLGPSYRAVPSGWMTWKCSGRAQNEICSQVLNDQWVSLPVGSEDGSFKSTRKNQYEELLFKCEDDRYELDLLIQTNLSAMKTLEMHMMTMRSLPSVELVQYQIKESDLDVMTVHFIRRLYDSRGDEIIKYLLARPAVACGVVLSRLKQKDMTWSVAYREWNVIWREINQKTYLKSLDHRSVSFKQEEKKLLNPKTLINEMAKKCEQEQKSKLEGQQQGMATSALGAMFSQVSGERRGDGASSVNVVKVEAAEKRESRGVVATRSAREEKLARAPPESAGQVPEEAAAQTSESFVACSSSALYARDFQIHAAILERLHHPIMAFEVGPKHLLSDVYALLQVTLRVHFQKVEREKLDRFWSSLIFPFFKLDASTPSSLSWPTGDKLLFGKRPQCCRGGGGARSAEYWLCEASTAQLFGSEESGDEEDDLPSLEHVSLSACIQPDCYMPSEVQCIEMAANKPMVVEHDGLFPPFPCSLFFGSESYYLMYRYLQILLERLNEAYELAARAPAAWNIPDPELEAEERFALGQYSRSKLHAQEQGGLVERQAEEDSSAASKRRGSGLDGGAQEGRSKESEGEEEGAGRESGRRHAEESRGESGKESGERSAEEGLGQQRVGKKSRPKPLSGAEEFAAKKFKTGAVDGGLSGFVECAGAVGSGEIVSIMGDGTNEKLLNLFLYERMRTGSISDAVYWYNCRQLLSDKSVYMFTFEETEEKSVLGLSRLSIKCELVGELEKQDESWMRYLIEWSQSYPKWEKGKIVLDVHDGRRADYGDLVSALANYSGSPLFLERSLRRAREAVERRFVLENGLGMTILPQTYKLRFVSGTEDFFQRSGRGVRHEVRSGGTLGFVQV